MNWSKTIISDYSKVPGPNRSLDACGHKNIAVFKRIIGQTFDHTRLHISLFFT